MCYDNILNHGKKVSTSFSNITSGKITNDYVESAKDCGPNRWKKVHKEAIKFSKAAGKLSIDEMMESEVKATQPSSLNFRANLHEADDW